MAALHVAAISGNIVACKTDFQSLIFIKILFIYDDDILAQAMSDSVFVTANIPTHKVELLITELHATLTALKIAKFICQNESQTYPFIIAKEANILGFIILFL